MINAHIIALYSVQISVLCCSLVLLHNQCSSNCTPLPLLLETDANCCTQQPQLRSATHTAGQHKAGNDKHIDRTERYRNAFLLCSCHFNQRTVLPKRKRSLNAAYQTKHIAIKLQNTRHITQKLNSLKPF